MPTYYAIINGTMTEVLTPRRILSDWEFVPAPVYRPGMKLYTRICPGCYRPA